MPKHIISKDFEFNYGHRVYNQTLNADFADDLQPCCRHLHGHECKVTVSLTAETLVKSMVTDFRHLEWLKRFLNTYIDHHFIIDENDPLYDRLVGVNYPLAEVFVPGTIIHAGYQVSAIDIRKTAHTEAERELLEGFFIVNFVPTSENLSAWLYRLVAAKMRPLGVTVDSIDWWESSKSRSRYIAIE